MKETNNRERRRRREEPRKGRKEKETGRDAGRRRGRGKEKQFHYFLSLRRIFFREGNPEDETGITIEFLKTWGKPKTHRTLEPSSADTPSWSSLQAESSKLV